MKSPPALGLPLGCKPVWKYEQRRDKRSRSEDASLHIAVKMCTLTLRFFLCICIFSLTFVTVILMMLVFPIRRLCYISKLSRNNNFQSPNIWLTVLQFWLPTLHLFVLGLKIAYLIPQAWVTGSWELMLATKHTSSLFIRFWGSALHNFSIFLFIFGKINSSCTHTVCLSNWVESAQSGERLQPLPYNPQHQKQSGPTAWPKTEVLCKESNQWAERTHDPCEGELCVIDSFGKDHETSQYTVFNITNNQKRTIKTIANYHCTLKQP